LGSGGKERTASPRTVWIVCFPVKKDQTYTLVLKAVDENEMVSRRVVSKVRSSV
jgi:hypothetical protein